MKKRTGRFVYKNEECMKIMHEFYDKALYSLEVGYREEYIETSYGKTHVLIVGDENKTPIFTLHGGNGISPLNIRLFLPLLKQYDARVKRVKYKVLLCKVTKKQIVY